MKQPEDNKTMDMLGGEVTAPKAVARCLFWMQVGDHHIEWQPLTKTQAMRMYKCTKHNTPDNATRYGWEVI